MSGSHLFIDHCSNSKERFGRIVSHARRTQQLRKQRQQKETAKQRAVYARSLVGWQQPVDRATTTANTHVQTTNDVEDFENNVRRVLMESTILTPADTGLRVDPFHAFPTDNSRNAMEMVDFYVTVWSQYKRGAIDAFLGLNTQIDMCWPIALQNGMLFDATLAVSRTAYCLGQKGKPDHDAFMLQHKVQALTQLRGELQSLPTVPSEAIIFTVSRMLSVCYMTNDDEAFASHFSALQRIAQRYMLHKSPEEEMARVVESRLNAWTPLFEYRRAQNPLIPALQRLALDNVHVTYLDLPSDEVDGMISMLPSGFAQLAEDGYLSVEVIQVLSSIQDLITDLDTTDHLSEASPLLNKQLASLRDRLIALLASLELSHFETQLFHALLGLAISLSTLYTDPIDSSSTTTSSLPSSEPPLETITKAFLYLKYAGASLSPTHTLCLQWAALVLGSTPFLHPAHDGPSRRKGHITLISISESLLIPHATRTSSQTWPAHAAHLQNRFFWPARLAPRWLRIYADATARQRAWETRGLLSIGVPSADKVEYMVLR